MPSTVLRCGPSTSPAKSLNITLAAARDSQALTSRDSLSAPGGDGVKGAGFAWDVFGNDRFEVVIEGAVGGFVELFGAWGFVWGNVVGFRWVWSDFEH